MLGTGPQDALVHGSVVRVSGIILYVVTECWEPNLSQVVKRWASGRPINRILWKPAWKT